jgi:CheY-like chemotaxis protein
MKRPRLLIVDDEESVTRTLQMVFEELGYAVDTALNSQQAIEALANGRKYDAVITDLNMEQEDIGLEVARAAKRRQPMPIVVIVTGYASPVNARSALQMHVDYFANKPVDLEELISNLDRLLARRGEAVRRGRKR